MVILIEVSGHGRLAELLLSQFTDQLPRYNISMQEPVATLPDDTPPKRNPGWFQPGDRRINRAGRPRGSKAGSEEGNAPVVRAPCADRLMLLVLPGTDLVWRLSRERAPWIVNLPANVEVVGCAHLAARDAVAVVLRSQAFPRVAKGAPVPEFEPRFNGLIWRRKG
jgi:hypothetical protein